MNNNKVRNLINAKSAVIAGFLTCLIAFLNFKLTNFSLNDFSNLYISEATLDNFQIAKRVSLFFRSTLIGFICLPIFYLFIQRLREKWIITEKEIIPLSIISFIGIFTIFTDLIGIESNSTIKFISIYTLYAFITLIIERKNKSSFSGLFHHPIIICSSILITTGILLLLNNKTNFREIGIVGYFVTNFLLSIAIQIIQKKKLIGSKIIFWYLLPICLIHILIFGSIEATFFVKLKFDFFLPFKWIFIGLIPFSYLIYLILPFNKKLKLKSNYQLTAYYFVPAAIISAILFIFYHPYIDQPKELFELANPANAQLKIFKFNEMPFIDFMSSHMFSEQFYGVIYNLIYGYGGTLDFITYKIMGVVLYYLVIYYFLIRLTKAPLYILLLFLFFPFLTILLNPYLIFTILLLSASIRVIKNQTIKNYSILIILTILLFIWRLDTGAAGFMTILFYFPILIYTTHSKLNLHSLIKAVGILSIIGVGIFGICLIFRTPEYIVTNIQNALHYSSANQAHGYTQIASTFPQQFYNIHLLFPVIAVLTSLYSVYSLRTRNHIENRFTIYALQSAIFLFSVYLANFQRGIVRHSFIENSDTIITSTFYIALVLFILSFFNANSILNRISLFSIFSFVLILLLPYFPINKGSSSIDSILLNSKIKKIDNYFQKANFKGKVIEDPEFARENYLSLKAFLDTNLSKNKTFMDFSNTPMLYFYCQRNVPSYFCQNLQNTIDDFSQLQHIKTIPTSKVPVVVYSNYPTTWFDKTDEVPNAMRQYLIAEYIYKHYKPYGIINKHSIWISKKSPIKNDGIEKDTLITQPQVYHYKNAAAFMYHHFTEKNQKSIQTLKVKSFNNPDSSANYSVTVSKKMNQLSGVLVSVELDHNIPNTEIKLELVKNKEIVGTVLFTTNETDKKYMVRISNQYFWFLKQPSTIQLPKSSHYKVKSISLYKDLRHGY